MNRFLATICLAVAGLAACASKPEIPVTFEPPPPQPEAETVFHLLAGEMAGRYSDMETAITHYLAAAAISNDPEIAQRASIIAVWAGDNDAALEAALRRIELDPDSVDARRSIGFLLLAEGRIDEALYHLDAVVAVDGVVSEEEFELLADMTSHHGNPDVALGAARLLAERYPGLAAAHELHARMAMRPGLHSEAAGAAARAEAIAPERRDLTLLLAHALSSGGETERAIGALTAALERHPRETNLLLLRARLLLELKRHEEARADFEEIIAQRPNDGETIFMLAMLNMAAERNDDAERYLRRLIELGDRIDEASFFLGAIAQGRGETGEALAAFAGVAGGERYGQARLRSADLLAGEGRIGEARAELRELRAAAEDERSILNGWLAEAEILRLHARNDGKAVEVLNRAMIEFPGDPQLLYARALAHERLGRIDRAEADLRTIIERDPDDSRALNALGYILTDRTDRHEEAYGYIERALELSPDEAAIMDSMGWVLYRLGRHEEAESWLRRAYALTPDPEIASNLATLLHATGRTEEARRLVDEALAEHPDYERLLETRALIFGE